MTDTNDCLYPYKDHYTSTRRLNIESFSLEAVQLYIYWAIWLAILPDCIFATIKLLSYPKVFFLQECKKSGCYNYHQALIANSSYLTNVVCRCYFATYQTSYCSLWTCSVQQLRAFLNKVQKFNFRHLQINMLEKLFVHRWDERLACSVPSMVSWLVH